MPTASTRKLDPINQDGFPASMVEPDPLPLSGTTSVRIARDLRLKTDGFEICMELADVDAPSVEHSLGDEAKLLR